MKQLLRGDHEPEQALPFGGRVAHGTREPRVAWRREKDVHRAYVCLKCVCGVGTWDLECCAVYECVVPVGRIRKERVESTGESPQVSDPKEHPKEPEHS